MKVLALFASLVLMFVAGCSKEAKVVNDLSVTTFAQKWFAIDLQKQEFGVPLSRFSDLSVKSQRDGIDWYWRTNASGGPDSQLCYGFQNDLLVAVEAWAPKKVIAEQVWADFSKVPGNRKSKYRVQGGNYDISFKGFCSPVPLPEEDFTARVTFQRLAENVPKP